MADVGDNSQIKLAIQGIKGSNHHLVVVDTFGTEFCEQHIEIVSYNTFDKLFADLVAKKVDYALIAIENSLAGSLLKNYDLLSQTGVSVIGESYLRVKHNLITLPDAEIEDIKYVYSHEMALKQCAKFIDENDLEAREYVDTADAVRYIMEEGKVDAAAIAPEIAASYYGASVKLTGLETNKENYTRFLWLSGTKDYHQAQQESFAKLLRDRQQYSNSSSETASRTGGEEGAQKGIRLNSTKTMLELILPHQPGSLAQILTHLAEAELNLTKIESRPIMGERWNYRFYLDFIATHSATQIDQILAELTQKVRYLRVLGRFPYVSRGRRGKVSGKR